MIILCGGIQMKIKRIEIKKLYRLYNYEIDFDESLTFLHGDNGCGKTTILNILASIVTGKIYNLVDYEFDEIFLIYGVNEQSDNIRITMDWSVDNHDVSLTIYFLNKIYTIKNIESLREWQYRATEDRDFEILFEEQYPFIREIRETFNYVFLPLNRFGMNIYDRRGRIIDRRMRHYRGQDNLYNTYLNDSLLYITEMVRDSCARINVMENDINEKFRKDVLTSSIRLSSEVKFNQMMQDIENGDWEEIERAKETYVKTLEEIDILNKTVNSQVDKFFEEFKNEYFHYKENTKHRGIAVDLVWKYSEFLKIKDIAKLAKDNEQKKEKIRKPREIFLNVIESFLKSSGNDKKIRISREGQIFFELRQKNKEKLLLKDLSSGEKQIIIIFASLIFGLDSSSNGIYIVDEPEASLHLEWQAQFVSAILKANKNVQLIFATHSPELIGKYRKNAVRLIRK